MSELRRAAEILRNALGAVVTVDQPLAPLTSFRVGGAAAIFVDAQDDGALAAIADAARDTGVPVAVIGKGSNILVADSGFPGIVLRLGRGYRWAGRDRDRLTAGGAMPLPALAGVALRHGLAGLEFGVAIPASVGGAVKMNAGAHARSMSEVVDRVEVYTLDRSARASLDADQAGFGYRRSAIPPDGVVVAATMQLLPGEDVEIRRLMDEAREWRRRTQPLAEPNCGSVFKNPDGEHAAALIEAVGAKGMRLGGAEVSRKHANFIVTEPGATAADVWGLIERVRDLVEAHAQVRLEPEVQFLGRVDDATE